MYNKIILSNEKKKIYLTDDVIYYHDKMYYISNKNKKIIKITKKNWDKYLKNYGWEIIDYKNNKKYNKEGHSLALIDCGGDGDCFFLAIAEAINNPINKSDDILTVDDLKKMLVDEINNDNYKLIINLYRIQKKDDNFLDNWNPDEIEDLESLREVFRNSGNKFWTDHIIMQLLQKALKTNINILIQTDYDDLELYSTMSNDLFDKSSFEI